MYERKKKQEEEAEAKRLLMEQRRKLKPTMAKPSDEKSDTNSSNLMFNNTAQKLEKDASVKTMATKPEF